MIILTKQHLKIPYVIANRYRHLCEMDEMVGEGLLALVKSARNFDPALCKDGMDGLSSYLFRGVRVAIIDYMRRIWKHRQVGELSADILDVTPGRESPSRLEAIETIDKIMQLFPPRDREIIRLTVLEGLSDREAGEILGCRRQNVHFQRKIALERVRRSGLINP